MTARPHRVLPAANDNRRSWAGTALTVALAVTPMIALALMMLMPMAPLFWGVR